MSDKINNFEGEHIDVSWDSRLCIHVGECGHADNDMFVGGRKPWCSPDAVSGDEAAEVVQRCPTGALSYVRKDGEDAEEADARNVVVIANNGPLYIRGELDIDGAASDMPGVKFRAALCRCGESSNKPFCDNTHEKTGFQDHGAVGKTDWEPLVDEGGKLAVNRAENGPLLLRGPVTIVTAAGRVAWQGEKCALCRCGQSSNKPFCDGSHKDAGFEAS